MKLQACLAAILITISTATTAAPTDTRLNLCYVVGYKNAEPGQSFFFAIAAHALNNKYPGFVATPECQDAMKAAAKVAANSTTPFTERSAEDRRILTLANSFVDQVVSNLHANLKGF